MKKNEYHQEESTFILMLTDPTFWTLLSFTALASFIGSSLAVWVWLF